MDYVLTVKRFEELTVDELYAIMKLRIDVFVVEQACAYPELDGLDRQSTHVFYLDGDGLIVAYLRVFERAGEPGTMQIGRVIAAERGSGMGRRIMEAGLDVCRAVPGSQEAYLEAQVYARGFYERLGFAACSEEFDEDGISHIAMRRAL